MIDYRFQGRLNYIPGGALNVQMSAWPAGGGIGTTDLISWWSMDETSGTRNDSHGTNHLTDNNSVLYGTGKQGNAADFELSNSEYLSVANNATLAVGDIDFTVAFWINPETINTVQIPASKWNFGTGEREWDFRLSTTNKLGFRVSPDGSSNTIVEDTVTTVSAGSWYYVVGWHDATANTINVQVNGGTVYSLSYSSGVYTATSPLHFGNQYSSGHYDGLMDEACFWKRVLTADERTWLFNSGNGRSYSEL